MNKYAISIGFLLLVLLPQIAGGADPFNSISGIVTNPDGSPCGNCTVTFTPNGQTPQICNGTTVYPKTVFTTTDANGNVSPISVYQGVPMIVTITDANGNISAQQPVPIPFTTGTTISQLLAMNLLQTQTAQVNGFSTGTVYVTAAQSPYSIPITGFLTVCDASSGPVSINLPATAGGGRWLEFKKIDSSTNTCTINPAGSDTIDGLSSYPLTLQYGGMYLKDGTPGKWSVFGPIRQQYVGQDYGGGSLTTVQNIIAKPQATAQPAALIGYQSAGTYDPIGFNAKMDGAICSDITVTNNSAVLSSLSCANFTGRAGELIAIIDPNGNRVMDTTISTVQSAVQVTLAATYTGTTYSGNAQVVWGNDDGAVMNQFINSQPQNSTFTIQFPPGRIMTVGTPISFNGRNVRLLGSGSMTGAGAGVGAAPGLGTSGASATGSLIVPIFTSAPTPAAVIYIPDTFGAEVGNLAISGDNLYANATTKLAGIETIHALMPGDLWAATAPFFHDLQIGQIVSTPLAGAPAFYYGIYLNGSQGQNDRGQVQRVFFNWIDEGIAFCPDLAHPAACQASEWRVLGLHCNRVAVCWDQSHGSNIESVDGMEDLSDGIDFFLGDAAMVNVANLNTEHDGSRTNFALPWQTGTFYPRNFNVQNGVNFYQQTNTALGIPGSICFSGPTPPTCTPVGATCNDGAQGCTWTNIGNFTAGVLTGGPSSMLAIGMDTGTSSAGWLNLHGASYDISSWLPPYGNPVNAVISADNGDFEFNGEFVKFLANGANPATGLTPVMDLTARGVDARVLRCQQCGNLGLSSGPSNPGNAVGINAQRFSADARSLTYIDVTRKPAYPHVASGDLGENVREYLIAGAAASPNYQIAGPLALSGGPLTAFRLGQPGTPFSLSCCLSGTCTTGAGNVYKYQSTCLSGTGETIASNEATVQCPAAQSVGTGGVTIQGALLPLIGCDHYKIYRTQAGGGSNTEKFTTISLGANQTFVPSLGSNTFIDNNTDASISGNASPPTSDTTGQMVSQTLVTSPTYEWTTPMGTPVATASAVGSVKVLDSNGNAHFVNVY